MFKEDFDIIHAHGNGAFSLLGRQVARVKGVPFVMTFHNLHTKYTHYVLNGKVLKPRMVAAAMRIFGDRKSTRLNSSHQIISYAVFCLKKKKKKNNKNKTKESIRQNTEY